MRILFCITLLFFIATTDVAAQNPVLIAPGADIKGLEHRHFNETLHFRDINGEIVITVVIRGKEYNFLFDTGAETVISPSLAEELLLEEIGDVHNDDGKGHTRIEKLYELRDVGLGNVIFQDVMCEAIDLQDLKTSMCTGIDGIIGANLMRNCYWTINFTDSTINISDVLPSIAGALPLHFIENSSGSPFIKLHLDGDSTDIEFDTGSNNPIILNTKSYLTDKNGVERKYATMHGIADETIYGKVAATQYRTIVDNMVLDSVLFKHVLVNMIDAKQSISNIGTSFMKDYTVILDWKSHIIYMVPVAHTPDTKFTTSLGLSLSLSGNSVVVALLWQNSDAERKGIKTGDRVTKINGRDVTNVTTEDFCGIKGAMSAMQTLQLSVKDGNREKSYLLKRYNLLEP